MCWFDWWCLHVSQVQSDNQTRTIWRHIEHLALTLSCPWGETCPRMQSERRFWRAKGCGNQMGARHDRTRRKWVKLWSVFCFNSFLYTLCCNRVWVITGVMQTNYLCAGMLLMLQCLWSLQELLDRYVMNCDDMSHRIHVCYIYGNIYHQYPKC